MIKKTIGIPFLLTKVDKFKISVIITAYDRRKFILEALESALNQTLPPSRYEVIVISNFDIQLLKEEIKPPITLIKMSGTIGEYLFEGISRAQNEIITFLEDDDIWDKGRLMEIVKFFSSFPKVKYYHNSQWYIDGDRKIITPLFHNPMKTNSESYRLTPTKYKDISKLISLATGFNLSSIAISKSAFLDSLDSLKIIPTNPDGFFFWKAVINGNEIYQDNRKLTGYRMHDQNLSLSKDTISKANDLSRQLETFKILLKHVQMNFREEKIVHNYLELQCLEWKSQQLMILGKRRRDIIPYFLKILKFMMIVFMDLTILRVIIYIMSYLIHPKLYSFIVEKISINAYAHQ